MADEFKLTPRPIRVTGAQRQALQNSMPVGDEDELDALCTIDGIEGGASSGLVIRIITRLQKETEVGWVTLIDFTAAHLAAVSASDIKNAISKMLRYIRWEVTSIGSGGATAVTFDIAGILRRRG